MARRIVEYTYRTHPSSDTEYGSFVRQSDWTDEDLLHDLWEMVGEDMTSSEFGYAKSTMAAYTYREGTQSHLATRLY